jgi:4-diphosphocytidyl-2-C-methyl-D-erythritol kinase
MAGSLGSDIPFFICQTTAARVTGRGECIEPIEPPDCFIVLVNPGFPSNTAAAFRLLGEYRTSEFFTTNHHEPSRIEEKTVNLSSWGLCGSWLDLRNDFLDVFPQQEKSVYNEIISQLRELGAEFAGLSGAGSTCFGVFNEKEQAQNAAEVLRKKWRFVVCCETM